MRLPALPLELIGFHCSKRRATCRRSNSASCAFMALTTSSASAGDGSCLDPRPCMPSAGMITATRRHSEVVDPYRQGLPVAAPPAEACRGEARGGRSTAACWC